MTEKKPTSILNGTQGAPGSDVEMTRAFAETILDVVPLIGTRIVVSGCVTAAVHIIVGRPLTEADLDIKEVIDTFLTTLFSHRDVLREGATNMAAMPKQVM